MSEISPEHNLVEYSVGEISGALKRVVEDNFGRVRVRGEISGFKRHTSGHLYFSLKDDKAVLGATWRASIALGASPQSIRSTRRQGIAGKLRSRDRACRSCGETSMGLVGKLLLLSALGCGATGVLLLQDHGPLGLALCAVALADLALVGVQNHLL
jgi:hypothetical protein